MLKFFNMNKMIAKIGLFLLITVWGCAGFMANIPPVEEEPLFVENGKIVQRDLLQQGGDLLIVPFTPGENVAANEDTNRESLLIVKGMMEILRGNPFSINVLSAEDADKATLLIVGRLTDKTAPGRFKRWLPGDDPRGMAVEGKLIVQDTRLPILEFSHRFESERGEDTYDDMAVAIGRDIGNYILSTMQKEVNQ